MKRNLFPLAVASGLLLSSCVLTDGGLRHGPPGPRPGKISLTTCSASSCDVIPVNMMWAGGVCTAKFNSLAVSVESGVSATFLLFSGTPEIRFRFTDPSNGSGQPYGIDIDYEGGPPAFRVGYGAVTPPSQMRYDVLALQPSPNRGHYYRFKINTEWSNNGTDWSRCKELDPVIAND